MDDDDLGFVADGAGDDLGFVEDDSPDDTGLGPAGAEPAGADAVPSGHVETGRVARELVLPEVTFEVDRRRPSRTRVTEAPTGPTMIERRRVERAPDPPPAPPVQPAQPVDERPMWERAVDWALSDVVPGMAGRVLDSAGIEMPSVGSIRRAVGAAQQPGTDASDVLSTLLPNSTPAQPIVGRDMRGQAMWTGVGQALTMGIGDELAGQLEAHGGVSRPWLGEDPDAQRPIGQDAYIARRDEVRRQQGQAMAQAPGAALAGQLAGSAPYAGIPAGAPTALGRIGMAGLTGAGMGFARGAGESEDASTMLADAGEGALMEGGLGALLAGGGEALGPVLRRFAAGMAGNADDAAQAAMRSRLEGTGVWGGRAMRAADEMPGGQMALSDDLRRLRIGGGLQQGADRASRFPRPERALEDAAEVMGDAAERMQGVLQQMDDAARAAGGVREPAAGGLAQGYVDVGRVVDSLEQVAREYDAIPVGGAQVARAIRSRIIRPLQATPSMTFSEAHRQRMMLDELVREWRSTPRLTTASGQLQTARRELSRAMDDAAAQLDPAVRDAWRQANRDYSVGAFLTEYGRGADRLSMQGGMGGAFATAIENTGGGNLVPLVGAPVQREAAQQVRMRWPGIRAVALEAMVPRLRAMGAQGERWARMLDAARGRGQTAVAAAHAMMMRRDPAYRQAVMQLEEQAAEGGEEMTP